MTKQEFDSLRVGSKIFLVDSDMIYSDYQGIVRRKVEETHSRPAGVVMDWFEMDGTPYIFDRFFSVARLCNERFVLTTVSCVNPVGLEELI